MKFNKAYLFLLMLLAGASCSKYIDKDNPDTLTDPEFWKDENSVRAYNWEFYNLFPGFGNGSSTNGDFYFTTFTDDQLPSGFSQYQQTTPATNGDWTFTYIRKANVMLERIDVVAMSDDAKNHWRGIARFFRALQYYKLVQSFGDVPWYSRSYEVTDTEELYKPRTPRKQVMDSVLADLNFAIANLRQADLPNTVNKDVALALKSRVCLYEGTYRKYHTQLGLPDADKYLTESKAASQALMARPYVLGNNYLSIYNADNLAPNKEVILYKRYEPTYLMHSLIAYLYSSTVISGLSKSAVESYLCTDGKPISVSPLYAGDDGLNKVLANRDRRLLLSIDTTYLYYLGHTKNGFTATTGYRVTKFLPDTTTLKQIQTGINTNVTDAPLFYLSEIYLNYAEAAAELDNMGLYTITQGDLDNTINKLRARAGVAPLTVNPGFTDTKKDPELSSLIWEIRRERRVELMMDGFRYQDLMRWKKGPYMDSKLNPDIFLGAKVPANPDIKRNAQGYITPYAATSQRVFIDPKNYLSAVPTNQILLYPADMQSSMQNPGWK
ncbi:RagB/SusD family nutrient uptake outer membrane protein [Longitalea arenae]|uniref:RagB/SusD family nutrient uptake outer membrane protein n=1 Tax=Longitalea arenae TaxID=2812558 RepID=UPI001966DE16|nr:RagB/SusD family nutrient uptake outer membrane protein [Longitalea arenae]